MELTRSSAPPSRFCAELVAQGVMGAEVEAACRLDQFSVALAHAQLARRSGEVLVTPAVQTA